MLAVNRTDIIQIVYDAMMNPIQVRPREAFDTRMFRGSPGQFDYIESIETLFRQKEDAWLFFIRTSSLGDVLLLAPCLNHIKKQWPQARLGYMVPDYLMCLFTDNPLFEPYTRLQGKFAQYDLAVNFELALEHAEGSGWGRTMHRSAIYATILGIELADYDFSNMVVLNEEDHEWARIQIGNNKQTIGIQVAGASISRSLPLYKTLNIAKKLQDKYNVVLLHDQRVEAPKGIINLSGQLNVRQLAAIVSVCDLIIAPDSGITHLSGCLGIPSIALMAAVPAENRIAYQKCISLNLSVWAGCSPCWEDGIRCGQTWKCLVDADENKILANAEKAINAS